MTAFFPDVPKIQYGGPKSRNPLEFKHYNPDEVVGGKTMKEHLRFSVVYWHTFCNPLSDPFGVGHRHAALGRRQQLGRQRPAQGQGRLRVLREARGAVLRLPRSRRRPRRHERSRKATPISTRSSRSSRTSRRAPASSCSGARPTSSPTRDTCTGRPPAPTSTSSPSPPPRSRRPWRSPTSSAAPATRSGEAAKATPPCSTPT